MALTLADDAVDIAEAVAGLDKVALVLGSEGHGLSLRWQAMADFYKHVQSPTPAGIKADGLRGQAIARFYEQQQRPTPEAIRADGLRWQAIARTYGVHTVTTPSQSSSGSGFDFGAAGIGVLAALGLAVLASGLMVMARRIRRRKLAV